MKKKIKYYSIIIFIISFLNFQFNLFKTVSNERFEYFQVESEQFVLDGFLNHEINNEDLKLGQFTRPSIDMFEGGEEYKPREWFKDKFVEGDFWEYKSHYGLQLIIFDFLNGNIALVHSIASFLLSLIITLLFIQLSKIHTVNFALIFIFTLVFNPWITPMARNGYFLIFIYFVPFLISFYYSKKINSSKLNLIFFLILLYVIFLFKSLIGYDYLSTIVLASMIPITYYYLKNNLSIKRLLVNLFLIFFVSVLSFSTSVIIHANSMKDQADPFNWIYYAAAKRLSSDNPEKLAKETCFKLLSKDEMELDTNNKAYIDCYNEFVTSLSVSRLEVFSKYMLARNIIPFLGSIEIKLNQNQETELKEIYYDSSLSIIDKGLRATNYGLKRYKEFNFLQVFSVFINFIISPIVFLLLFALYLYKTLNSNFKNLIFNLFVLLPPISWFLLAKGHSYITTYQLTFVLWYIFSVPYMVAILFSEENFN